MSAWTHEDRKRLTAEALASGDEQLIERCFVSDAFEPGLTLNPTGLVALFVRTRAEKRAHRQRVRGLFAEREAIKKRWVAEA